MQCKAKWSTRSFSVRFTNLWFYYFNFYSVFSDAVRHSDTDEHILWFGMNYHVIGRIYTRDELSDAEFILEDDLSFSGDLASWDG